MMYAVNTLMLFPVFALSLGNEFVSLLSEIGIEADTVKKYVNGNYLETSHPYNVSLRPMRLLD